MKTTSYRENLISLSICVCFIWAGMVLGISFLEAPLKFQAPGITLGLGLGIGRIVFGTLNKIENLFLVCLLVTWLIIPTTKRATVFLIIIFMILVSQTFWLLPVLDLRAESIINNKPLPAGNSPHVYYVVAEFVKLSCLVLLGFGFFQKQQESRSA